MICTYYECSSGEKHIYYNNILDAIPKIARYEGFTSLWRGLTPTLLLQIPSTVFYYTTYEKFKDLVRLRLGVEELYVPLIAGSSARFLTTFLTTPIEFIKTYIQATTNKPQGVVSIFRSVIRDNGNVKALWTGLLPTLSRDVPFSAIYWFSYELISKMIKAYYLIHSTTSNIYSTNTMKKTIKDNNSNNNGGVIGAKSKYRNSHFLINFVSGATAGGIAASLTNPIDVIKTRMQANIKKSRKYSTMSYSIASILREDGWKGFARGFTARVFRVIPASAIMISTYEFVKSL